MVKSAESRVTDQEIEAFAGPIYRDITKAILEFGSALERRYNGGHLGIIASYHFKRAEQRDGIGLTPLFSTTTEERNARAHVFLSGSGSTTRGALEQIAKSQNTYIVKDRPFVQYTALISDDPSSGAESIGKQFNIQPLVVDFLDFCRQCDLPFQTMKEAITKTNPFEPGLSIAEREGRLDLRVKFDQHLDERVQKEIGVADLDLLRGYRFARANRSGLDTHPAPLNYLERDGSPAFGGWHEGPIVKMIDSGFLQHGWGFQTSMILTHPIKDIESLDSLDAGSLTMLSQKVEIPREWVERYSLKDEGQKRALAGDIQRVLKVVGDAPLILFESLGAAPYLFAISREPQPKQTFSVRASVGSGFEREYVTKLAVYLLDQRCTGSDAFVLDEEGLTGLARKLDL